MWLWPCTSWLQSWPFYALAPWRKGIKWCELAQVVHGPLVPTRIIHCRNIVFISLLTNGQAENMAPSVSLASGINSQPGRKMQTAGPNWLLSSTIWIGLVQLKHFEVVSVRTSNTWLCRNQLSLASSLLPHKSRTLSKTKMLTSHTMPYD